MKTNRSSKIFKPSTLVSLGIAIAAALVTQPVRATAVNNIVLTENSSTSLTATYNGSTSGVVVTNTSADNWIVRFPFGTSFNSVTGGWMESANTGNRVAFDFMSDDLTVFSDVLLTGGLNNGDTLTGVGTDINGVSIDATFTDNAATSEGVPDSASTLGLLSLSAAALLGATRLRFLQLAA